MNTIFLITEVEIIEQFIIDDINILMDLNDLNNLFSDIYI